MGHGFSGLSRILWGFSPIPIKSKLEKEHIPAGYLQRTSEAPFHYINHAHFQITLPKADRFARFFLPENLAKT